MLSAEAWSRRLISRAASHRAWQRESCSTTVRGASSRSSGIPSIQTHLTSTDARRRSLQLYRRTRPRRGCSVRMMTAPGWRSCSRTSTVELRRFPGDATSSTGSCSAVVDLGRQLTPSPLELHTLADEADRFDGFRELLEHDDLAGVDPWVARNLVRLVGLHEHWAAATAGTTLLHLDIRGDNVLLLDDRVLFVDWPHACVGAAWIDLVLMLPSVAMQGGPPPESVLAGSGLEPRAADVTVVLAGLAGTSDRARSPARSFRPADAAPLPAPTGRAVRSLAARADWLALDHFRSSLSMRREER